MKETYSPFPASHRTPRSESTAEFRAAITTTAAQTQADTTKHRKQRKPLQLAPPSCAYRRSSAEVRHGQNVSAARSLIRETKQENREQCAGVREPGFRGQDTESEMVTARHNKCSADLEQPLMHYLIVSLSLGNCRPRRYNQQTFSDCAVFIAATMFGDCLFGGITDETVEKKHIHNRTRDPL